MREKIFEVFSNSKELLFYKIMKYPIPTNYEFFLFWKKSKEKKEKKETQFSRDTKCELMDQYIDYINKFRNIYKNIPFIKEIYLCNSITFNALHPNSDIDIFIVTKKNSLRRWRFFSVLIFFLLGIKRWKNKEKKFCLSFYTTEDNRNLYPICIEKNDIYLSYWLSHLVPLYIEDPDFKNIYEENKWINSTIPNHPQKHIINIWNNQLKWKTILKQIIEKILGWIQWKILEQIIKFIRLPIVITKSKRPKNKWSWIIINNKMLKFHRDIRLKIHLKYQTLSKKK